MKKVILILLLLIVVGAAGAVGFLYLKRGEIVSDGRPESALTPASVREAYGIDADVRADPVTGRPHVVALPQS